MIFRQPFLIALLTIGTTLAFVISPSRLHHNSILSTRRMTDDESSSEPVADDAENDDSSHSLPDEEHSDIMNSPAFLKRKLEIIQDDIVKVENDIQEAKNELEEGKSEWGDKLNQLQKEYITFQERAINQTKTSGDKATVDVARKILEVLDNYDRAFSSVSPSTPDEIAVETSYKSTYNDILATFEKLGVKEVETVGTEFDYARHNAVMMRMTEDYEEGIVCEELAKGYIMGEELIRPAMVCVSS